MQQTGAYRHSTKDAYGMTEWKDRTVAQENRGGIGEWEWDGWQ